MVRPSGLKATLRGLAEVAPSMRPWVTDTAAPGTGWLGARVLALAVALALAGAELDDSEGWIAPGILEALIPGRIQGHGGTAEVSGGAA